MKRNNSRKGAAIIEFCFVVLVLVPLLLGTIGLGLRLVQQMQNIQLARDAGRMYAREPAVDFTLKGNQRTLARLGSELGLVADPPSNNKGKAVVILSQVVYIDVGMCLKAGHTLDGAGIPKDCPNYKQWAFVQRIVVGNESLRVSNLGSPFAAPPPSTTQVAVNPATGKIDLNVQVDNPNDVAQFTAAGNPFINMAEGAGQYALNTLPSNQVLYVAESAAQGFSMPPFAQPGVIYSCTVF
jgi:hypothetical protein